MDAVVPKDLARRRSEVVEDAVEVRHRRRPTDKVETDVGE
jgi:hypothetical protein